MRAFPSWKDLKVGDAVTFCRTFTEEDVAKFVSLTIDYNPFHTDPELAAKCGFKKQVVPGLLTGSMIAQAGGTLLPDPYPASRVHFRFVAPVYIGETIYAKATILKINPSNKKMSLQITCANEKGEIVLEGEVSGRIIPLPE